MIFTLRPWLSALLSALVLLAFGGVAQAASPRLPAQSHAAVRMLPVSISITTTSGTVWGKVTATYSYKHRSTSRSCSATSCTLRIPKGVTVHLSQVATNTATWPFKDWKITANHRTKTVTTSATTLKVKGSVAISAVYILHMAQSSQSSQPTQPGYSYHQP